MSLERKRKKVMELFHSGSTPAVTEDASVVSDHGETILLNPGYERNRPSIPLSRSDSILTSDHDQEDPERERRRVINEEYESVLAGMDIGMIVQFQTLSTLLESVTMSTLRRLLLHEDDTAGAFDMGESDSEILARYDGTRIDTDELDGPTQDTTFSHFITGLNSEHLLQRELRSQMDMTQNLSFFRAFKFRDTRNASSDASGNVPVLIVGLVSINNQEDDHQSDPISADEIINGVESSAPRGIPLNGNMASPSAPRPQPEPLQTTRPGHRSWIIVVMAHQYHVHDTVLAAMPLFIRLLTTYVLSANSAPNQSTSATATTGDSIVGGSLDAFRTSLFSLFDNRRRLSQTQLDHHKDSMCVFREKSGMKTWKDRTDDRGDAFFEPGEHCPICMCTYNDGDLGRNLNCRHAFHKDCIDEWLLNDNTCPVCRGRGL